MYYRTLFTPKAQIFLLCLLSSFFILSCGSEKKADNKTKDSGRQLELTEELQFINTDGSLISSLKVAVADEAEERNQGLMDVKNMPFDVGMLFIFPNEEPLSFYMANTPLSLDIAFVNADSTIVRIHHSTTPFSTKQLNSDEAAQFVVETNAGYCVSNDIQEGMKIRF